MLHYDPQHVSSSTLLILRRTNCITTASDIVTLCKQPYLTLRSSTCFEKHPAHPQEDKLYYYSLWYRHPL